MNMRKLVTVCAFAMLPLLHGCVAAVVGGAAAGGYLVGEDRRAANVIASDERIEVTTRNRVEAKHPNAHISVVSFNHVVLLNGTAPDEAAKADIERIARGVDGVKDIYNEMKVGPKPTISGTAGSSAADGFLTSKVKARMVDARKFNPVHVKVVSEDGTVYLMGIVTRAEADAATEVARTTSGVKRVVRMFEYRT
jgi:osmotically-inducible protein OsmY